MDVGDSLQQCYFFGKLLRCDDVLVRSASATAGRTGSARYHTMELYNSHPIEAVSEFLTHVHTCFPQVPLSLSARELLSSAALKNATTSSSGLRERRPGASIHAKRRKTLSASNFYGAHAPQSLAAMAQSQESAWRIFYEKLQFRVSHSSLCQLEGTAAVSSIFPRQQEAFEFADQIAAFRRQMHRETTDSGDGASDKHESPRVFSFEDARGGKRRFLVSSFVSFWDNYVNTKPNERHVYEIIREGVPCRLYFDLGESLFPSLHPFAPEIHFCCSKLFLFGSLQNSRKSATRM